MEIFCCLLASKVGFCFSHLLCRKESTSTLLSQLRIKLLTWCEQWLCKNYHKIRESPCAFFLGPIFFCQLWSKNLVEFSLCWMLPLIRVILVKLNSGLCHSIVFGRFVQLDLEVGLCCCQGPVNFVSEGKGNILFSSGVSLRKCKWVQEKKNYLFLYFK